MDPERWQQIDQLFHSALERRASERAAFLAQACTGDEALRREVESLIGSHERSASFIEAPAADIAAELLAGRDAELTAGQAVGPYKIVSLLGEGGMGEVYLAQDIRLGRQVALKRLPAQFTLDAERVRRFEQEARAASALNHPNIVTIHEIGHSNSQHFITTEFVDGETLRQHMANVPMKLDEVLDIATQVASALAAAHAAGIVHRDIKPENIMIRPDGYVKVLDFGLAKLIEQENKSFLGLEDANARNQTAKGLILGTVNYMSPEQAKGERVDERTDIFSFGALIHEMVAGRTPFAGDSPSETFANLINAEPQPLSRFASNVPNELQRIVSKTLRKNKDERYQTMKDVLTNLKDLRKNLTLDEKLEKSHSPENGNATAILQATTGDVNKQTAETQYSFSRQIARHKSLAAFALVALLVGAIGLGYYFFYSRNAALSVGGKKSIAVLPLKPINTANRDQLYEIGVADSLILKLSSMKGFVVRPLSATRKYADVEQDPLAVGKEQQVDFVLASNYQLAGGKIKVTSQLVNVANGQIEGTYQSEQDTANVFMMQDAIAGEVGNKLLARFATTSSGPTARRGTNNEEAYRLYLQGRKLTYNRTGAAARKAVDYFEQAIKLDPNYALAYSGMAHAFITSGNLGGSLPRVEYEKAKEAVTKALELDDNLAEGYAVSGELKFTYEWDFAGAEKDLLRAVGLEPNSDLAHERYAFYLAVRGRFDEAIAEAKTAQEINPNSLQHQQIDGVILYLARRYDEATLQFKQIIEVDENHATAYGWLFLAYDLKGDDVQAYEWFMKGQKRNNSERLGIYQNAYETAGWQGVRQKHLELQKLNEQNPLTNYYAMARQCALVGEKEQAFEYLNKAIEKRQGQMIMLNVEPSFDILRRGDPRFAELVRRVGLE